MKNFKDLGIVDMERPDFASGTFGHGDIIKKDNQIWFYFQGTNDGGDTFKIGLAKHTLD
ncbi:hypothetical protein [Reichenbachiella sp. MALMAid0571]|uniref:hypothetical protein n=1 Tax=Reichenbachiella sp. MALMAid0571 TaxID=3143939 RepID=UPI0032DFABEE